jgi:hypothetical protein
MRADYDVDPEDGIMSLVVHLYKDGKEIQQDSFGRELSFENYKKAREWIDSRTYSLEDKLSQIANELDPYDGNAHVGEDKFGHYISFGESPEAVTRIYVKEDYTYDFVTMEADNYKDLLVDGYDWEKLVGRDWEKILNITNDDDNGIFEIDLPAIVKKYYVPFTNSVLSICSGKGLKNLLKDISGYSYAPDLSNSKRLLNMNKHPMSEAKKKSKKKRLGGTLNTDAGNVEHNIKMFNHVNSPIDGPANNPISGPMGGNVDGAATATACCESYTDGKETYYAAKYRGAFSDTLHKVYFSCDGDIEDAEKLLDELISEPYTDARVLGSVDKKSAERDGFTCIGDCGDKSLDDDFNMSARTLW